MAWHGMEWCQSFRNLTVGKLLPFAGEIGRQVKKCHIVSAEVQWSGNHHHHHHGVCVFGVLPIRASMGGWEVLPFCFAKLWSFELA